MKFSVKSGQITDAKSIEINEMVYAQRRNGVDVIVLSLGEAYFELPNFSISEQAILEGYHYTNSCGLPSLKQKIIGHVSRQYGCNNILSDDNLIISAGSKILTYMSMLLTLDPGSEVLLHEPAWLSYEQQASLCDAKVRFIDYRKSCADITQSIDDKTRLIIINNPNNPAGSVYPHDQITALVEAAQKKSVFVLIDEAYSDFVGDSKFVSASSLIGRFSNLIVVNSLSKNFGMSGWRIGFAASCKQTIEKMKSINQHLITCAPTILQKYVDENFDQISDCCEEQIGNLMEKRERVQALLDKMGFEYLPSSSTFYFFINTFKDKSGVNSLVLDLLEKDGVAVVPGSAYGESTGSFVRISFGTESIDRIEHALQKIKNRIM